MRQYDYQNKKFVEVEQYCQGTLHFLYETKIGRILLKIVTRPFVSKIYGKYQDSSFSRRKILKFIQQYKISMVDYEQVTYRSFNEFFCRKLLPESRSFSKKGEDFCAPCDAKLSIYPLDKDICFKIKHSIYSVDSLLQNDAISEKWEAGYCLVFRLAVDDYHRYHFFDDGVVTQSYSIPGALHTVSPISFSHVPVFLENSREVQFLATKHFGEIVQVEVGALMVGRIVNHTVKEFHRGEEMGYFQFGGSTIVLLVPRNVVEIESEIMSYASKGTEVIVKMGQVIGVKKK